MKLSLSWILDHIGGNKPKFDDAQVGALVDKFNKSVAEIEGFEKVSVDLDQLTLAKAEGNKLFSPELGKAVDGLAERAAAEGSFYLLRKDGNAWEWATLADLGSNKEGFVPAVYVAEELAAGGWKKDFEAEDYILEADNKSVNHRPDLWGHRGFAREIAAILDLPLKDIDSFVEERPTVTENNSATYEGLTVINEAEKGGACKRFAALDIPKVQNTASDLKILTRLARVDNRPIDMLVDLTNYVMWDVGQPMHAFDADKFASKKIIVRFAKPSEKLTLLDGSELELSTEDVVIADEDKALSLAGVMGGESSGVGPETNSLILESANFDAATIRKSAARAKVRTEASSRFEKNLDANQNILAIERYTKLLSNLDVPFTAADKIISLGQPRAEGQIKIAHNFIEKRLGVQLDKAFVVKALESIGFKVQDDGGNYVVTVPTYRGRGITIPEDLVEEVGRIYGFENIPHVLPARSAESVDNSSLKKAREIKRHLAFSADMMEASNYPMYDEQFLKELGWQPSDAVGVANPVSENWKVLVTSLVPHLLKNVFQNLKKVDDLSFFEVAKRWKLVGGKPQEDNVVAGVFYSEKKLDFYTCKAKLEKLFAQLGLHVDWQKAADVPEWFNKAETAELVCNSAIVGTAGNLSKQFLGKSFDGNAFAFELDIDRLLDLKAPESKYVATSKYQPVRLDISMMLPKTVTVKEVESSIGRSDDRIYKTELLDVFEKPEWKDQRSIAVRFHLVDKNKTLEKDEIDAVLKAATAAVQSLGAEVR